MAKTAYESASAQWRIYRSRSGGEHFWLAFGPGEPVVANSKALVSATHDVEAHAAAFRLLSGRARDSL